MTCLCNPVVYQQDACKKKKKKGKQTQHPIWKKNQQQKENTSKSYIHNKCNAAGSASHSVFIQQSSVASKKVCCWPVQASTHRLMSRVSASHRSDISTTLLAVAHQTLGPVMFTPPANFQHRAPFSVNAPYNPTYRCFPITVMRALLWLFHVSIKLTGEVGTPTWKQSFLECENRFRNCLPLLWLLCCVVLASALTERNKASGSDIPLSEQIKSHWSHSAPHLLPHVAPPVMANVELGSEKSDTQKLVVFLISCSFELAEWPEVAGKTKMTGLSSPGFGKTTH